MTEAQGTTQADLQHRLSRAIWRVNSAWLKLAAANAAAEAAAVAVADAAALYHGAPPSNHHGVRQIEQRRKAVAAALTAWQVADAEVGLALQALLGEAATEE